MFTRLVTVWDAVRSSLWALPLVMVAAACALAYAALNVELELRGGSIWLLFGGSSDRAPDFLSSLVTAMITMATLVVSITMVVLTLAAQQLGPRLIRTFMSDRRTQATLGLFVGTVAYLLLVMRSTYGQDGSVPNLAVTGGTVLVLTCVVVLILFVHHLAHSIIADDVIDRVGAQLDADIARLLLPDRAEPANAPHTIGKDAAPVLLARGGYVQAVDIQSIVHAAVQVDACVALAIRAGQHAVPGRLAAHVMPRTAEKDSRLRQAIQQAIVVGRERTAVQDLEFSVRQLVEVALRALSPGVNDPYTAIAVVDRLTLSIAYMMTRGEAQTTWRDEEGKVRLTTPVSTFEGVTDAAFNEIRQQALPAVLIRMAESIGELLEQAEKPHRPVLQKHLKLVVEAGRRCIDAKEDLAVLEARARRAEEDGKSSARLDRFSPR